MNETGELKKSRMESAIRRKRIKIALWIAGIMVMIGGLIGWSIYAARAKQKYLAETYQHPANQGQEHVPLSHTFAYNSNPPTSGPHFGTPADWGVYDKELSDLVLIHNLEHGGIWISYKPGISEDIRKKLEGFYTTWGRKIIVTPRAKNDRDIAIAAWMWLDTFDVSDYSDDRVDTFIKAFRNKGPEFVP